MSENSLAPAALRAIVRSFSESDAQDLSLELAGTRLRLTKWPTPDGQVAAGTGAAQASPATTAAAATAAPTRAEPAHDDATPPTVEIRAPRLGLFRPAAAARVGAQVAADDELGTIDVLGSSTTVPAGSAGTVVEIGAGAGDLVEYGQVLARIEVAS